MVRLRKERDDGNAGVAADDGDGLVGRVGVLNLGKKAGGTDYVESGDTEETFGVVDTFGFEDFGADGDGRVDLGGGVSRLYCDVDQVREEKGDEMYRVGNDENVGIGRGVSASFGEIADN